MKYRDLDIHFTIEDISFHTLNISVEKLDHLIPMHSHSKNSYEIHYISYGRGTLSCNQTNYNLIPGTLYVTGPKVEHEQISQKDDPMTEYCIYLKVQYDSKLIQKSFVKAFLNKVFWFGFSDAIYHEWMKQIISELEQRSAGYELVLKSLLQQVILYLARKYQEEDKSAASDKNPSKASVANDLTYLIIEEAFLYDYKDVTLKSLSEQIGLGVRQTERILKLHYQKTFQQKKTEARMSAAFSLLRDNSLSISDIALSLGYSSVEHFSNAFKKYYGETPSVYRINKTIE